MPSYFSKSTKSSEFVSSKYLYINNCGFCEDMEKTNISRPSGRKDYQLIYVKSGQMEFTVNGQKKLLTAGQLFFYRPGTPQYYRIDGIRTTFYWIHFTGSAVEEMLSPLPEGCSQTGEFPLFERFCKAFYRDYRFSGPHTMLHYEGELICLFAAILQRTAGEAPQKQQSGKLRTALLAMEQNLQPRLTNEQLSQLCGLNKHYFIKLFRLTTGMTPQQYYAQLIADKGKALLEDTDYSVSEIAQLCGIEDSFYFSRLFKKHIGLSPSAYRKRQHL